MDEVFNEPDNDGGENAQCLTLILGDDNFTFTLPFLESRHHWPHEALEVASCLPEDKIPNEYRPNYLALRAQGIQVYFGINPAQLRNHFFNNQYSRMVFVLPGLAFSGFPDFLDKKCDPLFRLRLHMYMFGFLKSSRNALKPDALIEVLWPRQDPERPTELPQWVPWHGMNLGKIGPFCEVFRAEANDEPADMTAFQDWHPLIHGIQTDCCPAYLQGSIFYCWRLTPPPNTPPESDADKKAAEEKEDTNLLFVPPELWTHPVEAIPHVNELFKFELKTNTGEAMVVSKPTLKFDPRFRADGAPARNPFAKRGAAPSGQRGRGRVTAALGRVQNPQMDQAKVQQPGIPHGGACQGLPGAMPPPPPPPPEMFQQGVLGVPGSDLYHIHGGQPPLGLHHSMSPHHPLYLDAQFQAAMGLGQSPSGMALRRPPPHHLLMQDELSLQYAGDPITAAALGRAKAGGSPSRYDFLDAELLGAGAVAASDYDAYRAMELGLPLTDQFGVPIYDVDIMNESSLIPAMEHQDVLLYERQGGKLAAQHASDILQQSAQSVANRQQLLEEKALLTAGAGTYEDPLLIQEMMEDPLLMMGPGSMSRGGMDYSGERTGGLPPMYRNRAGSQLPLSYDEVYMVGAPPAHHDGGRGRGGEMIPQHHGMICDDQFQQLPPEMVMNGEGQGRGDISGMRYSSNYEEGNERHQQNRGGREMNKGETQSSSRELRSLSTGDCGRSSRDDQHQPSPQGSPQLPANTRRMQRSRSPHQQRGRRPESRGPPQDWPRQRSRSHSRGAFRDRRLPLPITDQFQCVGGRSPPRSFHRNRTHRYNGINGPQSHRKITMNGDRSPSRDHRYSSRSPLRSYHRSSSRGRRPPQRRS